MISASLRKINTKLCTQLYIHKQYCTFQVLYVFSFKNYCSLNAFCRVGTKHLHIIVRSLPTCSTLFTLPFPLDTHSFFIIFYQVNGWKSLNQSLITVSGLQMLGRISCIETISVLLCIVLSVWDIALNIYVGKLICSFVQLFLTLEAIMSNVP